MYRDKYQSMLDSIDKIRPMKANINYGSNSPLGPFALQGFDWAVDSINSLFGSVLVKTTFGRYVMKGEGILRQAVPTLIGIGYVSNPVLKSSIRGFGESVSYKLAVTKLSGEMVAMTNDIVLPRDQFESFQNGSEYVKDRFNEIIHLQLGSQDDEWR